MPPFTSIQEEPTEEERALRTEQEWFLQSQVKPRLEGLQKELLACQNAARLQDDAKGALTLAVSSTSNDTLKGFVTLAGSYIVKGELVVKLPKLPVVKAAIHAQVPQHVTAPTASTGTGASAPDATQSNGGGVTDQGKGDAQNQQVHQDIQGSHQILQQALQSVPQPGQALVASQVNPHQLLHSYRAPGHLTLPYFLEQLKDVQNHTAQALLRLEDYWRFSDRSAAGSTESKSKLSAATLQESTASLKTLLELMQRHLRAGIEAMAQPSKEKLYPFRVCDPKIFSPALSEDFVLEFFIRDSQLVCAAYALQLTGGPSTGPSTSAMVLTSGGDNRPLLAMPLPQQPPIAHGHITALPHSTLTGFHPAAPVASSSTSISGDYASAQGSKSGQATPRSASPALHHHHAQQSHQSFQSQYKPQHQQHPLPQAKAYPWSPSRSPPTPQHPHHSGIEYHASSSAVPSNATVILPSSSKIGQTGKGGIKGKIATTIEEKTVQVHSPKLAEINTRLVQAETLCRRLLQALILQESAPYS